MQPLQRGRRIVANSLKRKSQSPKKKHKHKTTIERYWCEIRRCCCCCCWRHPDCFVNRPQLIDINDIAKRKHVTDHQSAQPPCLGGSSLKPGVSLTVCYVMPTFEVYQTATWLFFSISRYSDNVNASITACDCWDNLNFYIIYRINMKKRSTVGGKISTRLQRPATGTLWTF